MTRFLYLIGRMGLGVEEYRLAVVLAVLFWSGGRRQPLPVAHVSVTWLWKRGAASHKTHAHEALDRLIEYGVLERVARNRYRLRPDGCWRWPSVGRYTFALEEFAAARIARSAWGSDDRADMAKLLAPAVAIEDGPTAHPWDPGFRTWLDLGLELLDEYGPRAIVDAVRGWSTDPAAIPRSTAAFRAHFYALVQRGRRRA